MNLTTVDVLRLAIIAAALIVGVLWVIYYQISKDWPLPLFAGIWLVPVAGFFIFRFVNETVAPQVLNMISLSLYMLGIAAWGGVAVAKLKMVKRSRE